MSKIRERLDLGRYANFIDVYQLNHQVRFSIREQPSTRSDHKIVHIRNVSRSSPIERRAADVLRSVCLFRTVWTQDRALDLKHMPRPAVARLKIAATSPLQDKIVRRKHMTDKAAVKYADVFLQQVRCWHTALSQPSCPYRYLLYKADLSKHSTWYNDRQFCMLFVVRTTLLRRRCCTVSTHGGDQRISQIESLIRYGSLCVCSPRDSCWRKRGPNFVEAKTSLQIMKFEASLVRGREVFCNHWTKDSTASRWMLDEDEENERRTETQALLCRSELYIEASGY